MVSKRRRPAAETEAERLDRLMYSVPFSDEEPEVFWGPNIRAEIAEALREHAANPGPVYDNIEEFMRDLEESAAGDADV